MKQSRVVEFGELLLWGFFSLYPISTIINGALSGTSAKIWSAACAVYWISLFIDLPSSIHNDSGNRWRLMIFFALALSGFVMVYSANDYGKTTSAFALVLAARRLPHIVSERNSWLAVGVIAILWGAISWWQQGWYLTLVRSVGIPVFITIFVAFSIKTLRERSARDELAIANAELRASRELLAEHSRAAERLRISRDLHDTLGHHLTALSIQLDVAARRSEGAASDHVREAHAIARLLLSDVRDVVGQLHITGSQELADHLRRVTTDIGDLSIHLEMPENIIADNAEKGETLLRCVQEIVTNARRHADAKNLWIQIVSKVDGLELQARDDGRGANEVKWGHGLIGMRERFVQHGGRVDVSSSSQGGFTVHAFLPQREAMT